MKLKRKELDKHISDAVKERLKKYGYKRRNINLFKKQGDYFVTIVIFATGMDNNMIQVWGEVKPYIFDDIFWKVFQMEENLEQPMGLRANGAFTVRGLEIYDQYQEVQSYDEVEGYVDEMLRNCDEAIMALINRIGSDFHAFLEYSKGVGQPGLYDYALCKMLLDIKEENYQDARDLAIDEIKNHRHGDFANMGKYIYEYVVDFCEERIREG